MEVYLPTIITGHHQLDEAYRLALGDMLTNVAPYQGGLFQEPRPVILAGLDYDRPWTRDASINAWNGASLLLPEVARDTLLSVLTHDVSGGWRVGGQYWDAVIWITAAWHHVLATNDHAFLAMAHDIALNTLKHFEQTEFDARLGLFRGPACYGDGVAAYPDVYADMDDSGILAWPAAHPEQASSPGYGIPMHCLSTNILYAHAYRCASRIAHELGAPRDRAWAARELSLRSAIQRHLWLPERGVFRYLVGPPADCDHQEGLGHALALLLGHCSEEQARSVMAHQTICAAGIPCVWPTFTRYLQDGHYGRHSGTVWPHIQGFWGHATLLRGRPDLFEHELFTLARHACRDNQFTEVYHPDTGLPYGGLQEDRGRGIVTWPPCRRQTWSATAYLRLLLHGVLGLNLDAHGITLTPHLPAGVDELHVRGLHLRQTRIDVHVHRDRRRKPSAPHSAAWTELPGSLQLQLRVGKELPGNAVETR